MAAQVAPFTVRLPPPQTDDQAGNQAQSSAPPGPAQNSAWQQAANNNNANISDGHILAMIPASYRTKSHDLIPPRLDDISWIENELDVQRLHRIKGWFWVVGRPTPPRPLHHQVLLGREVFVTEQMDMHLVWTGGRMYLKPLPRFILEPHFWIRFLACAKNCACAVGDGTGHIVQGPAPNTTATATATKTPTNPKKPDEPQECKKRKLRKTALGFLFSYVALIRHESDLRLAKDRFLIPLNADWTYWTTLIQQLDPEHIYPNIDERFYYGELRLSRLNKLYRFTQWSPRGYVYRWQEYGSFMAEYFGLLTAMTVYIAIILTAMQVGLATDQLKANQAFMNASYGFTVLSILGPLIVMAIIFLFFLCIFGSNWYATVKFSKKRLGAIRADRRGDEQVRMHAS
ncbi:hypothetical protein AYL99_09860 [Fonsecaea erecta]|uniref:Uncharacterized protein n=1 Tax=Fonsecaea erecta TaxID=1367422 RepID=A0A178Z7E6_9EURO|nr:hypothetical protein AYL99_09860 [Fonsecaea erecta]OAP55708.1 hypothetical protein AYL99_09860 [Fonsecaea erecta]